VVLCATVYQEWSKVADVGDPVFVSAIGQQNLSARSQLWTVLVGDAKTGLEQEGQVVTLGVTKQVRRIPQADVDDSVYACLLQEADERFEGLAFVADGIENRHGLSKQRELARDQAAWDRCAVGLDVDHVASAAEQGLCEQHVAMAVVIVALAAHDGEGGGLGELDQCFNACLVGGSLFEAIIVGALSSRVIEGGIVWTTAQAVAQEAIADLCFAEVVSQQLTVELVHPAAVGLAAYVDDKGDAVSPEQRQELWDGVVAMADGIEYHVASLPGA
jgi:hypothetical protein